MDGKRVPEDPLFMSINLTDPSVQFVNGGYVADVQPGLSLNIFENINNPNGPEIPESLATTNGSPKKKSSGTVLTSSTKAPVQMAGPAVPLSVLSRKR